MKHELIILTILTAAIAEAATVTGAVVDDRDRPIAGATVWVHIRPDAKSRPKPFSTWTRTGRDGAFSVTGVPAGQFAACAHFPNSPYVDGCMWEAPRAFSLTDAARLNLGSLRLREGYQFRVKIDDPRGELDAVHQAHKSPDLQLGVWTGSGIFLPLGLKRHESNGQEYGAVVPYETTFRLTAQTRKLQLADEKGASVDRKQGFGQSLTIRRGKEPPVLRLQLTGAY